MASVVNEGHIEDDKPASSMPEINRISKRSGSQSCESGLGSNSSISGSRSRSRSRTSSSCSSCSSCSSSSSQSSSSSTSSSASSSPSSRSSSGSRSRSPSRSVSRPKSPSKSISPKAKRVYKALSDSEDEDENFLKTKRPKISDKDNEKDVDQADNFISDFDVNNKREEESSKRRKRDIDDDLIYQFIINMKGASYEDRLLNIEGKPATKKNSILKHCMSQLIKKDLQLAFLDHNILIVLTDWLTPLPNTSLPCLQIRESILKLLSDFPPINRTYIKQSGIEKAVMYLHKHPKETKQNREIAGRLISEWDRPIFNSSCDLKDMTKEVRQPEPEPSTSINIKGPSVASNSSEEKHYVVRPESTVEGIVAKEERQERDRSQVINIGKQKPEPEPSASIDMKGLSVAFNSSEEKHYVVRPKSTVEGIVAKEKRQEKDRPQVKNIWKQKPEPEPSTSVNMKGLSVGLSGGPGWVARARVPLPSNKDYVVRPKSTVEGIVSGTKKHKPDRFERCMKKFLSQKRLQSCSGRAVKVSLDGRKMAL